MKNTDVHALLRSTFRSFELRDEHKRTMRFPRRPDYIRQLKERGLVTGETDFIASDKLTLAVYLDWLRRPQVGCVFAQILARPIHRAGLRTVIVRGASSDGDHSELATQIADLVEDSVNDPKNEALSVLLPEILDIETLARLVWELGKRSKWSFEKDRLWRKTLVLIGLRVEIAAGVLAEALGMGPFDIFPPTRQCPITTLEIRTKAEGATWRRILRVHRAAHLAGIPVGHILTKAEIRVRFKTFTPRLRKRILGGTNDLRAKARVTYSIPAAIWYSLRARDS